MCGSFLTAYAADPLLAMLDWDMDTEVHAGDMVEIQAYYDGGEAPYECEWFNQAGEKIASGDLLSITAGSSQTYRFHVTSADGQAYSAKAHVLVIADAISVASFEDLPLEAESYWNYDPEADEYLTDDAFISGSFRFGNFPTVEWGTWGGFAYANETANTSTGFMQMYRNVVGGGANGTSTYAVAYMGDPNSYYVFDTRIHIATGSEGCEIPGMYVTNSAYAVNSIENGDGFCHKFTAERADYMTLIISGLDADGNTVGKIEVPLADFRNLAEGEEGYILKEWKWIDLSSLGAVKTLNVRYDSSQLSMVPSFVCIDEIGAMDPASVASVMADSFTLRYNGGSISVDGNTGEVVLAVYAVDGTMPIGQTLRAGGSASLESLPAGAYIAKATDMTTGRTSTLKFMRR